MSCLKFLHHSIQTGAVHQEFYKDSDLALGNVIDVWGRKFLICDCDEFTKEYYRTKYGISTCIKCAADIRAVPEIILGGVDHKHFFVLWVEGVLLTMCPRGGGGWGGNLSWGSRCI